MRIGRWAAAVSAFLVVAAAPTWAQSAGDSGARDPRYEAARGSTNAYSAWSNQDTYESRDRYQRTDGNRNYRDTTGRDYGRDYRDRYRTYGQNDATGRDWNRGTRDWSGQTTGWQDRDTRGYYNRDGNWQSDRYDSNWQSDQYRDRDRRYEQPGWQSTGRYGQYDSQSWQRTQVDNRYDRDRDDWRSRSDTYGTPSSWEGSNSMRDSARTRTYGVDNDQQSGMWNDDFRNFRRTDRSGTGWSSDRNNWNTRTSERDWSTSDDRRMRDADQWRSGDSDPWRGSGAAGTDYDRDARSRLGSDRSSDRDRYDRNADYYRDRMRYNDRYDAGRSYDYDSQRYRDDYNRRYNQYRSGQQDRWYDGDNYRTQGYDRYGRPRDTAAGFGYGEGRPSFENRGSYGFSDQGYRGSDRGGYNFGERDSYDSSDSYDYDHNRRSWYRGDYRNLEGDTYEDTLDEYELDEDNDRDWSARGARSYGNRTPWETGRGVQTGYRERDVNTDNPSDESYWDEYEID